MTDGIQSRRLLVSLNRRVAFVEVLGRIDFNTREHIASARHDVRGLCFLKMHATPMPRLALCSRKDD